MMRNKRQYDYFTMSQNEYGQWSVYGWGEYPAHSVLAGQPMKVFLDMYPTEAEALAAHPTATPSSKWTEPQVNLNHLPGEDDPVPGGMYPDDF
jgi:hypothetical protein